MGDNSFLDDLVIIGDDLPDLDVIARSLSELSIDLLLAGETGSGKDTLAQHLHLLSGRTGPFIAMNCAAIPESLFESELFGVVSGAYTGAERSRVGYLEAAQNGTLYLDELDSLPLTLQPKLLRVLETRVLERLGSTKQVRLDICVIASAQRPLYDLIERGEFRRDLYFRLNVITLQLLPLRAHRERIIPLFLRFARTILRESELELELRELEPALRNKLFYHDWPGNLRELQSAAKRFVLGLPLFDTVEPGQEVAPTALKFQLRQIERVLIQESLRRNNFCIDDVCRELNIPRRTLYHRMKDLGI